MSNQKSLVGYRPDIDGLRAIAVLSVIAFHVNESLLPGGFLGVDIFFVISGYLITLLLVKDIQKSGKLRLVEFYKRRIKRIFPALLVVLVVSSGVGFLLMAPEDYDEFSRSAFASLFSAANIYFYLFLDTSYFAAASNEIPLLHLWSLGIEEQYYIIWPFFIYVLIRYCNNPLARLILVCVGLLVSLFLAQISVFRNDISFAYYMIHTRAWELMAGGLVALYLDGGGGQKNRLFRIMPTAGLTLIAVSLILITEQTWIPALGAVPAVVGAAMIIAGGAVTQSFACRLLASRPMVLVGLISYSAYLWHWPILAYLRYALVEISLGTGGIVVVATLVLAWLTYKWVEIPSRRVEWSFVRIFANYFVIPSLCLAVFFVAVVFSVRYKWDFLYDWQRYDQLVDTLPAYRFDYNCQHEKFHAKALSEDRCIYPLKSTPDTLLIGDSNGAHFVGMLRVLSEAYGSKFRNATQSSCLPLLTNDARHQLLPGTRYAEGCKAYREAIAGEVGKYRTLYIGASWSSYRRQDAKLFEEHMGRTVILLSQLVDQVVILAQVPTFKGYNVNCEKRSLRMPWVACNAERYDQPLAESVVSANQFLKNIADRFSNVQLLDVSDVICNSGNCSPFLNKFPLYYDYGHLSMAGSRVLGEQILADKGGLIHIFDALYGKERVAVGGVDASQ